MENSGSVIIDGHTFPELTTFVQSWSETHSRIQREQNEFRQRFLKALTTNHGEPFELTPDAATYLDKHNIAHLETPANQFVAEYLADMIWLNLPQIWSKRVRIYPPLTLAYRSRFTLSRGNIQRYISTTAADFG